MVQNDVYQAGALQLHKQLPGTVGRRVVDNDDSRNCILADVIEHRVEQVGQVLFRIEVHDNDTDTTVARGRVNGPVGSQKALRDGAKPLSAAYHSAPGPQPIGVRLVPQLS